MRDARDCRNEHEASPGVRGRRDFLKDSSAALATSILGGSAKGANNRLNLGFIGVGNRGRHLLSLALKRSDTEVTWVCDAYQPRVDNAVEMTGGRAKGTKDFRQILADRSVDALFIATPCHWHAYMTVEACKAGKDVYVEKPACLGLEEGRKMVMAARKHSRVVQVGLQQRAAPHFQRAVEMVRGGQLGKVTFCRTWNYGNSSEAGMGQWPDSDPPPGLDWEMWVGPAPRQPFNAKYWFAPENPGARFSYFWAYGGGMVTDWAVHLLDIVQMAFDEAMPRAVTALGGKYWLTDERDTPDTIQITYEYPGFLAVYENRWGNAQSMFDQAYGTIFHGAKGTLFVNRGVYRVLPERDSDLEPAEEKVPRGQDGTPALVANFLECAATRQRPICDIEAGYRSTAACILGNGALLSQLRLDWDDRNQTVLQKQALRYCNREYRKPWKLFV